MRSGVSPLVKRFSVSWTWWSSVGIKISIMITIARTRVIKLITWNRRWTTTRSWLWILSNFRTWTISWIKVIAWIKLNRTTWKMFIWMYEILVCFKVLNQRFHSWFRSRKRIPFSSFFLIFPLFMKTIWERVIGYMTKITVFPKWGCLFLLGSDVCVKIV